MNKIIVHPRISPSKAQDGLQYHFPQYLIKFIYLKKNEKLILIYEGPRNFKPAAGRRAALREAWRTPAASRGTQGTHRILAAMTEESHFKNYYLRPVKAYC